MSKARFDFYEKVRIESGDPQKREINGRIAAILGRAQGDDGQWTYAVHVYGFAHCWSCSEDELQPTGEIDRRESFYDDL